MIESDKKRYNPPSEDFAETRLLLKDERTKNEQLVRINKVQAQEIIRLQEVIADILDDTGANPYDFQ